MSYGVPQGPTGYGHARDQLYFNGDEKQWELWEERFMAYMRQKKLHDVIDPTEADDTAVDAVKNAEAYAELVRCLDDRSLGLIMRDAKNDGRKALKILRSHYAGSSKPRIIMLYNQLTSLRKAVNEDITDYIIKAETLAAQVQSAGAKLDPSLLIAMVLKGLPSEYHTFSLLISQNEKVITFQEFKVALRNFEENEKASASLEGDRVMKADNRFRRGGGGKQVDKPAASSNGVTCYKCGAEGHKANDKICPKNLPGNYCSNCDSYSHPESKCRKNKKKGAHQAVNNNKDVAKVVQLASKFHSFAFMMAESNSEYSSEDEDSFLVDSGSTSHIAIELSLFVSFDPSWKPELHTVELADGRIITSLAEKRGTIQTFFRNNQGELCEAMLHDVLYMPTFPSNIFSVKAVLKKGCSVCFYPHHAELITPVGTIFDINCETDLFYLKAYRVSSQESTRVNAVRDLQTWHNILGHCNKDDIVKLQNVVDGMKISDRKDFVCEPCILGKHTETVNREPSKRATRPLEFVSTDVCGNISPVSSEGFEYAISFTDNYSGYIFLYMMKKKSDAARALQKFLADISPIGKVHNLLNLTPEDEVKKMRSDNGGEYMGAEFKNILLENRICHEQCAPYSPHQNGIAERGWRTLFDSARSSMVETSLPKTMWPYALMNAVHIRNRCLQKRTKQTPYFMLTGRKPDVSILHIFGTVCYSHEQQTKKLDNRCKRGVFVGYDRESPSYLVYHEDTRRVQRCRCVKFTDLYSLPSDKKITPAVIIEDAGGEEEEVVCHDSVMVKDVQTENVVNPEVDSCITENPATLLSEAVSTSEESVTSEPVSTEVVPAIREPETDPTPDSNVIESEDILTNDHSSDNGNLSSRSRNPPSYLADYFCMISSTSIPPSCLRDYVCMVTSTSIPLSYNQAMASPNADEWKQAMDDEIGSLIENETYELVPLPKGKKTVGGRWVYNVKDGPDDSEVFKARFVAKGFTQIHGMDYFETFSPTVKMTSIRAFMQIAAEFDLSISQMDVKTAFLNAPIDCEIYVQQPKGYEKPGGLVCRLKKSLYGLKQSGRLWNHTLHEFFNSNELTQSRVDPCVYFRKSDDSFLIIVVVWVDDLIIGARNVQLLNEIKELLKNRFKMKDLGPLKYFLGIEFTQVKGSIKLAQSHYTKKLLTKFGMIDAKPRSTPCEPKPDIVNGDSQPLHVKYREVVGSLIYLMTCTRPDLSWTVTRLSQKLEKPGPAEWVMLKHVLQYLKGTINCGLMYHKSTEGLSLIGYSDSDWASCQETRRSTSGYYFALNHDGPPVSWKSRKQPTVALSSCEAEYMALTECTQEAMFLKMLLSDVITIPEPIEINGDNQGAISLVKNPIISTRSKHIDVKHHFVRETYAAKSINVSHVGTDNNVADLFTKPITKNKLFRFRKMLFGNE